MQLPILIIADITRICNHYQLLTEFAGIAENNQRQFHDYH